MKPHWIVTTPLKWWKEWVRPRSTNRDEAFRESTIRATVAVLLSLTTLSLSGSWLAYEFQFELVSYPTLTLFMMVVMLFSASAVVRQRITQAGQLLVLSLGIGGLGVAIIDGFWANIVPPTFMLIIVITALVLPRSTLIPVGLLNVGLFALIALLQEASGRQPPPVEEGQVTAAMTIFNVFFLLLIEVMFLRQLRLEFDGRLAAVSEALVQAEKAREEADRANQAKSEFLASVSHEFRTPLNAVIGYADILISGMAGALSEKQSQIQKHIRHNSKRLLAMINNTLDMAKIEAGKVEVVISQLSPREVIEETVGGMESLAEHKNITLTSVFTEGTPDAVKCDLPKLQQILTNLIGNAIKFTSEGGVRVEAGGNGSNEWYFKVIDSGIGMPEDAASYIFDPFSQVDTPDTRGQEGTGLGLAIVKRHLEYMGGSIKVETMLGKGTTFVVTLPREVKDLAEETPEPQVVLGTQ